MAGAGPAWLLLSIAGPGHTDAHDLMAHYRSMTSVTEQGRSCRDQRSTEPDEIIVCKSRDQSLRLPLPDERDPYSGPRRPTGDVSTRPPGPPCPPGGCTGINLLKIPQLLYKVAEKVIDPDS